MICDVHVHVGGVGGGHSGNYAAPAFRRSRAFRRFSRRLGLPSGPASQRVDDRQTARRVVEWLEASAIDRAVFLGLDAAYREDGSRDDQHTRLVTDNDFIADLAAQHRRVPCASASIPTGGTH